MALKLLLIKYEIPSTKVLRETVCKGCGVAGANGCVLRGVGLARVRPGGE